MLGKLLCSLKLHSWERVPLVITAPVETGLVFNNKRWQMLVIGTRQCVRPECTAIERVSGTYWTSPWRPKPKWTPLTLKVETFYYSAPPLFEPKTSECTDEPVGILAIDYLAPNLSPKEKIRFEAHASECKECTRRITNGKKCIALFQGNSEFYQKLKEVLAD